jgi:hypothetical protein
MQGTLCNRVPVLSLFYPDFDTSPFAELATCSVPVLSLFYKGEAYEAYSRKHAPGLGFGHWPPVLSLFCPCFIKARRMRRTAGNTRRAWGLGNSTTFTGLWVSLFYPSVGYSLR